MDLLGTLSIVSHGHGRLIENLLNDLTRQSGIGRWRIMVTINIPERIEAVPGLDMAFIENTEPKGFGANHNACAEQAEGRLFVIVNPDIRIDDPQCLEKIAAGDWDGAAALRAPVVLSPAGEREDSVRKNLSISNLIARSRHKEPGWEVDPVKTKFFWLAGMFLIARLDQFRAIGGFNDRFRLYCEDYDLSARWRTNGGIVEIMEGITVVHDARRDSHRSLRHLRWHVASLAQVWCSPVFWKIVFRRF